MVQPRSVALLFLAALFGVSALGCPAAQTTATRVELSVPETVYLQGFTSFDLDKDLQLQTSAADASARLQAMQATAGIRFAFRESGPETAQLSEIQGTLYSTEIVARDVLRLGDRSYMVSTVKVPMATNLTRRAWEAMDYGAAYKMTLTKPARLTSIKGVGAEAARYALQAHYGNTTRAVVGYAWIIRCQPRVVSHGATGEPRSYSTGGYLSSEAGGAQIAFDITVMLAESDEDLHIPQSQPEGDGDDDGESDGDADSGDADENGDGDSDTPSAGSDTDLAVDPATRFSPLSADAPARPGREPYYQASSKLPNPLEIAGLGFRFSLPNLTKISSSDRSLGNSRARMCLRWMKNGFTYDIDANQLAVENAEEQMGEKKEFGDRVEFSDSRSLWVSRFVLELPSDHPAVQPAPNPGERWYDQTVTYTLGDEEAKLRQLELAAAYGAILEDIDAGHAAQGRGYFHRRLAYRLINDPDDTLLEVAYTIVLVDE